MAQLYRKYMRLLDTWPVDKTRVQDLGQHLREQIKIAFAKGENTRISNPVLCEKYYQSLDRIASNYHSKKYPHILKKTSTGLTKELCTVALSLEGQKELQKLKVGFFDKVKVSVQHIWNKDKYQS